MTLRLNEGVVLSLLNIKHPLQYAVKTHHWIVVEKFNIEGASDEQLLFSST